MRFYFYIEIASVKSISAFNAGFCLAIAHRLYFAVFKLSPYVVTAFAVFLLSFFAGLRRRALFIIGCRSPPSNLNFQQKIQIGGKDMEGNRPKRRKDKYNPYTIFEKDGQGALHKFEISKALYDTFDSFELSDLVYLNVVDRHIEQSEVWENTLNMRAMKKPDSMEEIVFRRFQEEKLHKAINELPEKQKKRLILHYFQELTYVEIAEREKCSTRAVEYSIHGAIQSLKKFFEKN
jgi:RNA polymerase sigma factor (sigma-70 family)